MKIEAAYGIKKVYTIGIGMTSSIDEGIPTGIQL